MYFGGMKHGKGTYSWNNGSVYSGDWENNKITGQGVYKWHNGKEYTG